ncbi:hypothetical protein J132_02906 [Termitomyces sp. J132]|nr:hypothetical protein J132_02906 [Termitomyces sp. J132]
MDHRLFQELIIPFEDHVQSQSAFNEVFREAIRGPRYMRYNYWGEADVSKKTLADCSPQNSESKSVSI